MKIETTKILELAREYSDKKVGTSWYKLNKEILPEVGKELCESDDLVNGVRVYLREFNMLRYISDVEANRVIKNLLKRCEKSLRALIKCNPKTYTDENLKRVLRSAWVDVNDCLPSIFYKKYGNCDWPSPVFITKFLMAFGGKCPAWDSFFRSIFETLPCLFFCGIDPIILEIEKKCRKDPFEIDYGTGPLTVHSPRILDMAFWQAHRTGALDNCWLVR